MKCTIEKVMNIELKNKRIGSSIKGFIPTNTDLIPDNILKWMFYYSGVKVTVVENGIKITAWAETTCSTNDKYDYELGSHVAESKAKLKMYRFIRMFSKMMCIYYNKIAEDFADASVKYDHCVEHEINHIDFLSNDLT